MKILKIVLIVLVVLTGLSFISRNIMAACSEITDQQRYDENDAVFIGEITKLSEKITIKNLGLGADFFLYKKVYSQNIIFNVLKSIKGDLGKQVSVYSEMADNKIVGNDKFSQGKTYIVLAKKQADGTYFAAPTDCSGTHLYLGYPPLDNAVAGQKYDYPNNNGFEDLNLLSTFYGIKLWLLILLSILILFATLLFITLESMGKIGKNIFIRYFLYLLSIFLNTITVFIVFKYLLILNIIMILFVIFMIIFRIMKKGNFSIGTIIISVFMGLIYNVFLLLITHI
jgi:hypothetical protein